MLNIERNPALTAVDALAVKLFKEVFLELVARKFTLLIFHAGDCRVLHPLCIELYQFLNETLDRDKPCQVVHPGYDGIDTML